MECGKMQENTPFGCNFRDMKKAIFSAALFSFQMQSGEKFKL
jgi:hypothetical protein